MEKIAILVVMDLDEVYCITEHAEPCRFLRTVRSDYDRSNIRCVMYGNIVASDDEVPRRCEECLNWEDTGI